MSVFFGTIVMYQLPNSGISRTISFARMYEYAADDSNIHGTLPYITIPQKDALIYILESVKSNR